MSIRNVILRTLACGESGVCGKACYKNMIAMLSRNEL